MSASYPNVFIGSSVEGLPLARALEAQLQHEAEITIWKDGIFQLSENTMESLARVIDDFDFAVLVLSPDDVVEFRGDKILAPRDNVVLEYGLFAGRIGYDRTFFVIPSEPPIKLPSDLFGLKPASYNANRKDKNTAAALSPVATEILDKLKRRGRRRVNSTGPDDYLGIRDCHLRSNRLSNHIPLARAKSRVYLLGATLVKYAVEIQEVAAPYVANFRVILPDPRETTLVNKWLEVSPSSRAEYFRDLGYTLQVLKSRHMDLGIQFRLTDKLLLSSLTLVDDTRMTVEQRFYGFEAKDRVMIDIDPQSSVGKRYINGFEGLFEQSRPVVGAQDFDELSQLCLALAKSQP
ncbi:MAG: nucleotide-binding protein [Rhodocyclaceae bacterium]|nr:nucleotide-binding protein [Rhodocyclaceae bacterium]